MSKNYQTKVSRISKNTVFDSSKDGFSTTNRTAGLSSLATTSHTLKTMTDDQMNSGRRMLPSTNKVIPTLSIDLQDFG